MQNELAQLASIGTLITKLKDLKNILTCKKIVLYKLTELLNIAFSKQN